MKTKNFLIILFGLFTGHLLLAQQPKYELFWVENFNGSAINEKYWSKIPRGESDWNRHMSDESSLYEVKNGNLILRGKINKNIVPEDSSPYITGGVYTKDKKMLTFGKVEVRAKLQGAKGAWPAIWMLPNKGRWPDDGEIDIMERLNHDSIAYQTVHSYYTYVLKEENNPPHGSVHRIDPDDYNVYAVEILPDSLIFSINGSHTFTYPRIETTLKGQYPFGTPFYILIDMQIGGNWVGEVNPEDFPAEMKIDWVKMYVLKQ